MRNLFLNTLQFLSAWDNQQDATTSGRFDEVVDSKTLNFFTLMANSAGEPRTKLQRLKYLEDSVRTRVFYRCTEGYPLVLYILKTSNVGLPSSPPMTDVDGIGINTNLCYRSTTYWTVDFSKVSYFEKLFWRTILKNYFQNTILFSIFKILLKSIL